MADDRQLTLSNGALNVAHHDGRITQDMIAGEIGEVLAGHLSGRDSDDQVTTFCNVGLAFQDLVACQLVYDRAIAAGAGTWVELL